MLVVNKREQLRPDGLSSRSRTVSSLHPRSPNIKVKFKLLVLSYHRKPTLWLIKVKFQVKRNPSSFLCLEAYFFQEIPHPKLEEPRKAATLHFNKIWICNLLLKVQIWTCLAKEKFACIVNAFRNQKLKPPCSTIQRLLSTQSLQKVHHWAHNLYGIECLN